MDQDSMDLSQRKCNIGPTPKEAAGPTITAPPGVPVASASSLSPTPSCLSHWEKHLEASGHLQ